MAQATIIHRKDLAPVVENLDNPRIVLPKSLMVISYPVDSAIHHFKIWGSNQM